MTPIWHDGPLSALRGPPSAPVVWSVRLTSDAAVEALATVRASARDLADAAGDGGDGARRLARRRLGRALVAHLAGCHPDVATIHRTPAGAPIVAEPPGWYIGFSARGDHCLVGAARIPVAVDREARGGAIVLADMLTPAEVSTIGLASPADRPLQWTRRWTIKEAFAKLTGAPRGLRPETIETVLNADGTASAMLGDRVALCWTRIHDDGIETVATWTDQARPAQSRPA